MTALGAAHVTVTKIERGEQVDQISSFKSEISNIKPEMKIEIAEGLQ